MFEWLFAEESRLAVFVAACVVGIFLAAAGAMLELFWEMAFSILLGLIVAAQYGFFIALLVFPLALITLYEWGGRKVRVNAKYLHGN